MKLGVSGLTSCACWREWQIEGCRECCTCAFKCELEVEATNKHRSLGVADGLEVNGLGSVVDVRLKFLDLVSIDEADFNTHALEKDLESVVGTSVPVSKD